MKRFYCYLLFLLCGFIVLFIYLIGVINFLYDQQHPDPCAMTYTSVYPQYVRIFQQADSKFPKYGLYAYAEGDRTKKARSGNFDGIPILFIPGNAGSHQQVRSIATVALRIASNSRMPYHFDYFTVDLNGDFSAFYGAILYDQVEFVYNSVERILQLYNSSKLSTSPSKVVLIGHSLGGVIGKKVLQIQEHLFRKKLVDLLITLASPIQRAHIYFDIHTTYLYEPNDDFGNYMLINIAGGYRDLLVPTYLTRIKNDKNNLNVAASHIPNVWIESNHVQILWCNQLVLALNRALFDTVNKETMQISTDSMMLNKIFSHHLIHNSGTIQHLTPNYKNISLIDHNGEWIENTNKQFTIKHETGLEVLTWYMVTFTSLPNYEMLTILAINLPVANWIYMCNAGHPMGNYRMCVEAENLTPQSEIAFSTQDKRRFITINMHELHKLRPNYTHVIFKASPTSQPIRFHVDIYASYERKIKVSLPKLPFIKEKILDKTPSKAVVYSLIFPELEHLIQSYSLFVEPKECKSKQHYATASLIVPWAHENVHTSITNLNNKPLKLRVQNSKPSDGSNVFVRLVLDPLCIYEISIIQNMADSFGQIARYYSINLFAYAVVIYLLTLENQFYLMETSGKMPMFIISLFNVLKNIWILVAACVFARIYDTFPLLGQLIPKPENQLISHNSVLIDSVALPIILSIVSFIITLILVTFHVMSLFTMEYTVNRLVSRLVKRCTPFFEHVDDFFPDFFDFLVTSVQRVPIVMSITLIILCFIFCGGIGLCAGVIYYFLKVPYPKVVGILQWELTVTGYQLSQIYHHNKFKVIEDRRENAIDSEPISFTGSYNATFFHSSMFFLWVLITFLNIPSILTWGHNFRFSIILTNDTSLFSALVLCLCGMPLWHFDLPKTNRKYTNLLRVTILTIALICLIYGQISWYRIKILLTLLFVLITIHQCYPFGLPPEHQETFKPDEMKMKIE